MTSRACEAVFLAMLQIQRSTWTKQTHELEGITWSKIYNSNVYLQNFFSSHRLLRPRDCWGRPEMHCLLQEEDEAKHDDP